MAILIKDTKLPDCCAHCSFKYNKAIGSFETSFKLHFYCKFIDDELHDIYLKRNENCPMIKVPESDQISENNINGN